MNSDILEYELQYNFTIRECNNEGWAVTMTVNSSLRQYTITNSTETPVEEDSVYNITVQAVNSDWKSEASISMITTPGAGSYS